MSNESWIASQRFSTRTRASSTSFVVAKADKALVEFELQYQTEFGDSLLLAGNSEELGRWDSGRAVQMTWSEGHIWTASVVLPISETQEFKCVVRKNNGGEYWQPGENIKLVLEDYNFSSVTGMVELKVNMDRWESNAIDVQLVGETLKQVVEYERAAAREAAAATLAEATAEEPLTEVTVPTITSEEEGAAAERTELEVDAAMVEELANIVASVQDQEVDPEMIATEMMEEEDEAMVVQRTGTMKLSPAVANVEAVAAESKDNSGLLAIITALSVMALVGGTGLFFYLNTGSLPFPTFPTFK